MVWEHDALAADLRNHLAGNQRDRLFWCDMQLGPAGSPRPDVYVLPKSYSKFTPTAYEVKISRADFQSDVNAGKWQKYYAFASAVVFAVPDGLIKTTELPGGAGLIVRKANVWRLAKAPKVNALDNLPRDAWLKLVMDGIKRLDSGRPHLNTHLLRERAFKAALGDEIAKLAADKQAAEWQIRHEIDQHKKRLEEIQRQNQAARERANERDQFASVEFAKLCDLFGLPHGSPTYMVSRAINEAIQKMESDARVKDLIRTIDAAQHALASAKLRVAATAQSEAA